MITRELVIRDYNKLKKLAKKAFLNGKITDCLDYVSFLSFLMYNFNIIYADDEIENLLRNISKKYLCKNVKLDRKTVLFYDWWGWETRGLTNIYLNALVKNNYKIIFVTQLCNKNACGWIEELFFGTENKVIYISNFKNYIENLKELQEIYYEYVPATAFMHTYPSDVVGVLFFHIIKSVKFQINLTDHAFWIGTKCFDYCIEFRDFGYNISLNERHIEEKRLKVLPYYPVITDYKVSNDFEYLMKKIGRFVFSGGSVYKINGSDFFYNFVKELLLEYKDLSFVFIGNGDIEKINEYFRRCSLQERVFCFSERDDFVEFFKRCEFYLDTFPINGALMTQYAVVNGAIPVSFNFSDKQYCSDSDISGLFLQYSDDLKLSFDNVDEAKKEIGLLLSDKSFKSQKKQNIKSLVISKKVFNESILELIESKNTQFKCNLRKLNLKEFSEIYIDSVNKDSSLYYLLFVRARRLKVYMHFFINTIKGLFNYHNIKKIGKKLCKFHF